MKNAELIARLRLIAGKGMADYFNSGHPNSNAITEAADAIEALESQLKNASVSAIAEAAEVDRMKAEVDRLTTLARGQHIELYNARLQLAAAQGQEPVAWQCKEIGGSFWQECAKERGLVRAARPEKWEVRPLYAAPIPQQPASLLALLTTRSILIWLYEKLGGVIESSTPISREIEPWPRVSITEDSLCDLRKIWESLPKMQEDLMRHVEAAHNQRGRNETD